jgi:hypothetical protein
VKLKDGLLGDVPMVTSIGSLDESTCGALEAALRGETRGALQQNEARMMTGRRQST